MANHMRSKSPSSAKFSWSAFLGIFFALLANIAVSFVGYFEGVSEMLFASANYKINKQRFYDDVTKDIENLDKIVNDDYEEEE